LLIFSLEEKDNLIAESSSEGGEAFPKKEKRFLERKNRPHGKTSLLINGSILFFFPFSP